VSARENFKSIHAYPLNFFLWMVMVLWKSKHQYTM
jgi:hypothetical protein